MNIARKKKKIKMLPFGGDFVRHFQESMLQGAVCNLHCFKGRCAVARSHRGWCGRILTGAFSDEHTGLGFCCSSFLFGALCFKDK